MQCARGTRRYRGSPGPGRTLHGGANKLAAKMKWNPISLTGDLATSMSLESAFSTIPTIQPTGRGGEMARIKEALGERPTAGPPMGVQRSTRPERHKISSRQRPQRSVKNDTSRNRHQLCADPCLSRRLLAVTSSTPKGTRTPVLAVRGRCPRPLDDGGGTPS